MVSLKEKWAQARAAEGKGPVKAPPPTPAPAPAPSKPEVIPVAATTLVSKAPPKPVAAPVPEKRDTRTLKDVPAAESKVAFEYASKMTTESLEKALAAKDMVPWHVEVLRTEQAKRKVQAPPMLPIPAGGLAAMAEKIRAEAAAPPKPAPAAPSAAPAPRPLVISIPVGPEPVVMPTHPPVTPIVPLAPAVPAPAPEPKKPDTRKLPDVPIAEQQNVMNAVLGVETEKLKVLIEHPDIIPWQKELIEVKIKEREVEATARKAAQIEASRAVVAVPDVPPEVQKVLKYTPDEFAFAISQFSRQEAAEQEALAIEILRRNMTAEDLKKSYEAGAMGIESLNAITEAIGEVAIPKDLYHLQTARRKLTGALEEISDIANANYRLKKSLEKVAEKFEEEKRRKESEIPPPRHLLEAKQRELTELSDEQIKFLYEESQKTGMVPWQRTLVLTEANIRNLIPDLPEPKMVQKVGVEVKEALQPYTYGSFIDASGKFNRFMLEKFAREWGLDPSKAEHKDVIDMLQGYLEAYKQMPSWNDIPSSKRYFIDRSYRAALIKKYGGHMKKLVDEDLVKSPDKFAGMLWTKYGKYWMPVPPGELGLVKAAYPGGLEKEEWKRRFTSILRRPPYNAGPKLISDLYGQYGRKGEMPPLETFQFSEEVKKAIERGTEPGDIDAVMKLIERLDSPLTYEDALSAFSNNEARARKAYEGMFEYTDEGLKSRIENELSELSKTPEGKERLRSMALTDNREALGRILAERIPNFRATEGGFKEFGIEVLESFIPKTQTSAELVTYMEQVREDPNSEHQKVELQTQMENIRPTWESIQKIKDRRDLFNKWNLYRQEIGRDITASEFFMRYPEVSKQEARTIEETIKLTGLEMKYGEVSAASIQGIVPKLAAKIASFKAGDDKRKLIEDVYDLERLNDLYKIASGKELVEKVKIGTIGEVSFSEARNYAKGRFKTEWLMPEDYEVLKKYITEKLRVPTKEEIDKLYPDVAKAAHLKTMLKENALPLGIKLDDTTIVRIGEVRGLKGKELEEAVISYRTGRELPMSAIDKEKKRSDDARMKSLEEFQSIMERPLPPEAEKRLGEIKSLTADQAGYLTGMSGYIAELETELGRLDSKLQRLSGQKSWLESGRERGKKMRIEQIEKETTELETSKANTIRSLSEAKVRRIAFANAPVTPDYSQGLGTMKYDDYIARRVRVKRNTAEREGRPVDVSLADLYKYWVAPLERYREEFVKTNNREPYGHELAEAEPTVDAILKKEKETGKLVPDHEKQVAAIVFMNYSKERGAYPFEYQMADLAWSLGVKDIPMFVLPAETNAGRIVQFKNWLKLGLKRSEVEGWDNHVKIAFIGDDWTECDWEGVKSFLFSMKKGHREHLREGPVDVSIAQLFKEQKVPLADDAEVEMLDEKTWSVHSGEKRYRIEETDRDLQAFIYKGPRSLEDVSGQKQHVNTCAIRKAKVIQGAALQFIEPRVLQPIIQEVGKGPSEQMKELMEIAEGLKAEVEKKTEQALKAFDISKDALTKLKKLQAEKEACDAKLTALGEEVEEVKAEALVAMKLPPGEALKRETKRGRVSSELKKKEAELKELEAQIEAATKTAAPTKQKEVEQAVGKELAETKKALKSVMKKVVKEQGVRDICFLPDEWDTIKVAINEHLIANERRTRETADRLSATRAAGGVKSEVSMLEGMDKQLREEGTMLRDLNDYIKSTEAGDPDRFLCTEEEEKTLR